MSFAKDLAFGLQYENHMKLIVPYDIHQSVGYCKTHDGSYEKNGETIYYEVKADKCLHRTNNVCIEFASRGSPSGITTTRASEWYFFEAIEPYPSFKNVYCVPTDYIRELIQDKKYHRTIRADGNDCYLFKRSLFVETLRVPTPLSCGDASVPTPLSSGDTDVSSEDTSIRAIHS